MDYLDRLSLAVDQHASGVTGDQTSGLTRAGNTLSEAGGVYSRWWDSSKQALDNPLLHNPDGSPRAFSSLTGAQQTAVVLRTASNVAGAVMGALSSVQDALNVGFANLTAPLAAIWPSFPASSLTSLYVGMPHGHKHPPSLIPAPPPTGTVIPLPSLGCVLIGNHVKTLIGVLPAARCGDVGLAPTCVGITPFFEIVTGSSNVFIGGKRAARMLDICKACGEKEKDPAPKQAGAALAAVGAVARVASKAIEYGGLAVGALAIAADVSEAAVEDGAMGSAKALSAAMNSAQMAADAAAMATQKAMGKDGAVIPGPGPAGAGPMKVMGALVLGNPLVLIGGFPMVNIPDPVQELLKKLSAFRGRSGAAANDEGAAGKTQCS